MIVSKNKDYKCKITKSYRVGFSVLPLFEILELFIKICFPSLNSKTFFYSFMCWEKKKKNVI